MSRGHFRSRRWKLNWKNFLNMLDFFPGFHTNIVFPMSQCITNLHMLYSIWSIFLKIYFFNIYVFFFGGFDIQIFKCKLFQPFWMFTRFFSSTYWQRASDRLNSCGTSRVPRRTCVFYSQAKWNCTPPTHMEFPFKPVSFYSKMVDLFHATTLS
jgi:hypothetical protein